LVIRTIGNLAALFIAALFIAAAAPTARAACLEGSPSPDGSQIFPVAEGQTSCVLTDNKGIRWRYQGDTLFNEYGRGWIAFTRNSELQINDGGKAFLATACQGNLAGKFWIQRDGTLAIGPASPLADSFVGRGQRTSYSNLGQMLQSGRVRDGDHLEVKPLPPGLAIYRTASRITQSGITLDIDAGARIGCVQDEGNSIIPFDTSSGPIKRVTIEGHGGLGEIAYLHDLSGGSFRCVNIGKATDTTLKSLYIHDCDMGLIASGHNGTTTLSGVIFDHNGSGYSAAATHNMYLSISCPEQGCDTSVAQLTDVRSYCTDAGGFELKSRYPSGTWTGIVAAEPSPHGMSECRESAAMDFSCGGRYTVGAKGRGKGFVAEIGPGFELNDGAVIRWNMDPPSVCPRGGWSNQTAIFQNCWIINDSHAARVTALVKRGDANVTVKDCKIVGNGTKIALGDDVRDGGGNVFYASRPEAGLPPYPSLPPVP
jgi:hypothetical protein